MEKYDLNCEGWGEWAQTQTSSYQHVLYQSHAQCLNFAATFFQALVYVIGASPSDGPGVTK
jgi:hypothetical protein